jgi:hypothetical protein
MGPREEERILYDFKVFKSITFLISSGPEENCLPPCTEGGME